MLNTLHKALLITIAAGCFTGTAKAGPVINTADMDNKTRLIVSREIAKSNQNIKADDYIRLEDKRDEMFDQSTGDCGNVNIGNVTNERPVIGAKPESVTVVLGNVVNLGDDC